MALIHGFNRGWTALDQNLRAPRVQSRTNLLPQVRGARPPSGFPYPHPRNIYVGGRQVNRSRTMTRTMTRTRKRRGRYGRRRNYRRRASHPGKVVRVFKTVKYIALNPGAAGAIDVQTMVPNSAYDPTGGAGTEQPLGFDQVANMYNKYMCIRAKYFFEATSADATNPVMVGAHASVESTTLTSYQHYKELPNTVSRIMTPEQDKVTFGLNVAMSKLFGNRLSLVDDRYTADVGSNASNSAYLHVFAQPVDGATDTGIIHLVCTLYQTVIFFKPKTLARS